MLDVGVMRKTGGVVWGRGRGRRLDAIGRALAAPAEFKDKLADVVDLVESRVLDRRLEVKIRRDRAAVEIRELLREQLRGFSTSARCARGRRGTWASWQRRRERKGSWRCGICVCGRPKRPTHKMNMIAR